MFNLPQWCPITRHPLLQRYTEELINDLLSKILNVYSFNILILDKEHGLILEKYVIDLSELKQINNRTNDIDKDKNTVIESTKNSNTSIYNETEIFNDLRSSINDLVKHLEKLNKIKDDMVSFDFVINTVNLTLGHSTHVGWNINNQTELTQFERDINWTKYVEDENLPTERYPTVGSPYIKLFALVGCNTGPLIIHNYMEIIQDNRNMKKSFNSNDTVSDNGNNSDNWFSKIYYNNKNSSNDGNDKSEFDESFTSMLQ